MTMRKKSPPPLAMLPNPVLSCLSSHSDPIVLETFDVTLWYSGVSRTPNLLKILKVISEMTFSANCAQVWKLNRISMTIINKVARKCIRCCQNVQWCVTAPQKGEGGIVQRGLKGWSRQPCRHVFPMRGSWTDTERQHFYKWPSDDNPCCTSISRLHKTTWNSKLSWFKSWDWDDPKKSFNSWPVHGTAKLSS